MGFGCTVAQTLLIRELLVTFFGNELVIGLILGCWFVTKAIGSGLLGRLAKCGYSGTSNFAVLQILFALFLPICLYAAYTSRSLTGAISGEGVGLVPIGYTALLVLAPLALADGAMFAFGCREYGCLAENQTLGERRHLLSLGRVYVCEAMGAIAGGVVFTYLFVPLLVESLSIALLLSSLNSTCAKRSLPASGRQERSRNDRVPPGRCSPYVPGDSAAVFRSGVSESAGSVPPRGGGCHPQTPAPGHSGRSRVSPPPPPHQVCGAEERLLRANASECEQIFRISAP